MTDSQLKREITRQLDNLPFELQLRVLDFVKALVATSPRGVPGKLLLAFAGTISTEDARAMSQAIEAECERPDRGE